MKRVRLTIHPGDLDLPRTFERTTGGDEQFARVQVVNWNVSTPEAAFLLRVRGDTDRFARTLRDDPAVGEYEVLPVDADECYCFVTGDGTADAWGLWEQFGQGSLLTIPPAEWRPDGSYTFTVVGRDADIQAAVEGAPDGVRVEIEAVGGDRVAADRIVDALSDRQREVVRTAIELGYYDVPRRATSETVADEIGCATSTAAEHIRKAEANVMRRLLGD